jgi:hypothetical protein
VFIREDVAFIWSRSPPPGTLAEGVREVRGRRGGWWGRRKGCNSVGLVGCKGQRYRRHICCQQGGLCLRIEPRSASCLSGISNWTALSFSANWVLFFFLLCSDCCARPLACQTDALIGKLFLLPTSLFCRSWVDWPAAWNRPPHPRCCGLSQDRHWRMGCCWCFFKILWLVIYMEPVWASCAKVLKYATCGYIKTVHFCMKIFSALLVSLMRVLIGCETLDLWTIPQFSGG